MSDYDPGRYGRSVGERYDRLYPESDLKTASAARLIARLAREQTPPTFLEFGIGTGRLALAVLAEGIDVAGIDGSESMLSALRAKGLSAVETILGDYRDARVERQFSAVGLVFNGIFDPRGLDVQADIFRNAARHLRPGGYFIVETWVMTEAQARGDWAVTPRFVGEHHVEFQLSRFDLGTNRMHRTLLHLFEESTEFVDVVDTYASPRELDLIAHFTGFERVERYESWDATPFTWASTNCISVYRLR